MDPLFKPLRGPALRTRVIGYGGLLIWTLLALFGPQIGEQALRALGCSGGYGQAGAACGGPLQGLTYISNGIMAGFAGRQVCLSVPYLPHAWPISYRYTLDEDIVGVGTTPSAAAFLVQQRAGYIDQAPTRSHQLRGNSEQA